MRAVINDMLRVGLQHRARSVPVPFRVNASDLGLREGIEIDDIAGLLDRIEGPSRR